MKQLSMEEQEELVNDWFNGKYFIEIKPQDYRMFTDFISAYDTDYYYGDNGNAYDTFYAAWRFCDRLHHHKLELTGKKNNWKGKMLSLDKVRQYISEGAERKRIYKELDKFDAKTIKVRK